MTLSNDKEQDDLSKKMSWIEQSFHSGERNAFGAALSDTLRPLSDPIEVQALAARLLGEYLQANRVAYVEILGEEAVIHQDYVNGLSSLKGRFHSVDFGPSIVETLRKGETLVVNDITEYPTLSESELDVYRAYNIGSYIAVSLIKAGEWVAVMGVYSREPRIWTANEITLAEETAERTWAAVEQSHAEAALRASEAKYRSLFNSIDEGYILVEVLFNDEDKPYDILYLEANSAANKMTGVELVGKRTRELDPNYEEHWFEIFGRVAKTGIGERHELTAAPLNAWYNVFVFKLSEANETKVAAIYQDITARKRTEAHNDFLADITEQLALASSTAEIVSIVGERASRVFGISVCNFIEISDNQAKAHIAEEWHDVGGQSLLGTYDLADCVTAEFRARVSEGQEIVVRNVAQDPRIHDKEKFAALRIGSFINIPLIRDKTWEFVLGLYHEQPYDWHSDEIALLLDMTTRIWNRLERVRAERALHEADERLFQAEEYLRMMLDSAKDYAIFSIDIEGIVTTWNAGAERMFGYTEEEIMGQSGHIIYALEDREARIPEREMRKAADEGYAENERWHLRKDGSRFYASGMVRPIRDEKAVLKGFTKVARDTTESKLIEGRNQIIQELSTALSVSLTMQEVVDVVLKSATTALGAERSGMFQVLSNQQTLERLGSIGLPSEYAEPYYHISIEAEVPIATAIRNKDILWIESLDQLLQSYPHITLIEHQHYQTVICLPFHVQDRITGAIYLTFPYPKKYNAQEHMLLTTISQLCGQALERSRLYELEAQARQEAEKANALKTKFLGMISHELRTPLASIKGFASTLLASDVVFTEKKRLQFLSIIDQEADKLTGLVDQLLDLSRLQSGSLRIELKPISFVEIMNAAMPYLKSLTTQHQLNFKIPKKQVMVMADRERIVQVLINLVGNAAKFSPAQTAIQIRATRKSQHLQIDVSDEGIGIPLEEQEKIFEAFHQARHENAKLYPGAGLGLAICKSIIEAHHGKIWLQDKTMGTTLSFSLPYIKEYIDYRE